MTTFKHGDKVTCKIKQISITDARISIDSDGTPYICQNAASGSTASNMLGYSCSWMLESDFTHHLVTDLCLAVKTWDNLEAGDILVLDGDESKVLAVIGDVFLRSTLSDFSRTGCWYTKSEAQKDGLALKAVPEEIEEVTMEDVCKKFGKEVRIKNSN